MTIAEGQAVVETAKRYRRVYQTGTQRLSEGNFIFANEMLRTGRLGKVHTVRAHIAPWDATAGVMETVVTMWRSSLYVEDQHYPQI